MLLQAGSSKFPKNDRPKVFISYSHGKKTMPSKVCQIVVCNALNPLGIAEVDISYFSAVLRR